MSVPAKLLIALVALEHLWFLVLETVLWRRPFGLKTFGLSAEQAEFTAPLAFNEGIYNGFLAAGMEPARSAPARAAGGPVLPGVRGRGGHRRGHHGAADHRGHPGPARIARAGRGLRAAPVTRQKRQKSRMHSVSE